MNLQVDPFKVSKFHRLICYDKGVTEARLIEALQNSMERSACNEKSRTRLLPVRETDDGKGGEREG